MFSKASKISKSLSELRDKREDEKDGGADEAAEGEAGEKKGLKLGSIARKLTANRMKAKDGMGGKGKKC